MRSPRLEGRSIALEDPCLPDHRATAIASGLDVVPIDVDRDGARSEAFTPTALSAAVLTPAHQAPLGATLAAERRAEFVRIATQCDAYVVEDDYDGEFRYDRHPIGALQGLAPERVIYAGSASKSLAPGLRLGWLALPGDLLDAVVEAKRRADRGSDVLTQPASARCARGCPRRLCTEHAGARDRCGSHAVVSLPQGVSEADVLTAAQERRIALTGLAPFWHRKPHRTQGLVLGYGTPSENEFPSALEHLGRLLRHVG
jgi:GntR family transcriptional regulator/MocR family aminotransferase